MFKKNRMICFSLIGLLLLSISTPVSALTTIQNSEVVYIENMNYDSSEAEKQVNQSLTDAKNKNNKINLTKVNINGSNIYINGKIKIKNNTIPIELEGKLKRTDTSNNIIVGDLKDTSNKFEVIHFSIDIGSDNMIPAIKQGYSSKNSFNIYLRELNTNNITFIQTDIPNNIDINTLFSNINNLELFNAEDLFWYSKVVRPVGYTEKNIPDIESPISPKASGSPKTSQKSYKIDYTWMSEKLAEFLWVEAKVISGNLGYVTYNIRKFGSYTWNYTKNKKLSNETITDVREVSIKSGLDAKSKGNFTALSDVGGDFTSGDWTLSGSFSYSMSLPIPGTSISFGFSSPKPVSSYPKIFDAPSFCMTVKSSYYMVDNGENLGAMAHYRNDGSGSVVTTFEYRIYTPLDSIRRYDSISITNSIY